MIVSSLMCRSHHVLQGRAASGQRKIARAPAGSLHLVLLAITAAVVHVFVALADNEAQGIVPVPKALGDGQNPRTNLYWGARYGVATYLERDAGWKRVSSARAPRPGVLERIVLEKKLAGGRRVRMIADAWDGREMRKTIEGFLRAAGGHDPEIDADVVAFVGHDGLMELEVAAPPPAREAKPSIVLACISKRYFGPLLKKPILLTNGLMAPEAYTLDAAIEAHFGGRDVRSAAATAYCKYQRCGRQAGLALFSAN